VHVHVDDGRAFLERTDKKYDVILYSLPDSLTLVAGQAGLRLESFLFTKEAIEEAKAHLNPGGTFALFGYFPTKWQTDRMAALMQDVFDETACIPGGVDGVKAEDLDEIIVGPGTCMTPWRVQEPPLASAPTDDRPFPYLRGTEVPGYYLLALGLILAVSAIAVRLAGGPFRRMRGYLDLFFMGAAFLLLETKSVVQFALLFGTTWFVNALVFTGILLVVLAAVEFSRRVRLRHPLRLYPILFATLAVAWLVPPSALLPLPVPARFVAAVLLAFAPVFVANVIFAQRFRTVEASTVAFGANLLGAMVGGVLEYTSLVLGYRMLLVLAALLYALALVSGRKALVAAGEGDQGPVAAAAAEGS
jgi:hypothetical protein